jgi:hypothetical protein
MAYTGLKVQEMALFGAVWPELGATVGKRWILVFLVLPLPFGAFPL